MKKKHYSTKSPSDSLSKRFLKFVEKSNRVHDNKYEYDQQTYKGQDYHVAILCHTHGQFLQKAYLHSSGRGCPECGKNKLKGSRLKLDDFKSRASSIHQNKYDYSDVQYSTLNDRISIICSEHGEFKQTVKLHLSGSGCKNCVFDDLRLKLDDFKSRSSSIHQNKYDYSLVDYSNLNDRISIICPEHGTFSQLARSHLDGHGCKKCVDLSLPIDDFVHRASSLNDKKYDYSGVKYDSIMQNVDIVCPKHGKFRQIAHNHLNGSVCPECQKTINQDHARIHELLASLTNCEIINNYRGFGLEVDLWIPELHVGFEYHGEYWHSSHNTQTDRRLKNLHARKVDMSIQNGFRMYQIFSGDNRLVWESIIKNVFKKNNRIFARKCCVSLLDSSQEKVFFAENHLQGYVGSSVCYGLILDGQIVCAMSFIKKSGYWEIQRLASLLNITVVGGASRLFSRFIKDRSPSRIITFADRRYSIGDVYRKLGFKFLYHTNPNYCYIRNKLKFSRQKCQKKKLERLLGDSFDSDLTEHENMFRSGFRRLWDAGNLKFEMKLDQDIP